MINNAQKNILGIDIGGTNCKMGVITRKGEILHQNSFTTNNFPTPEEFISFLYDYLQKEKLLSTIEGIGIGAPNGNFFKGSIDFAPNLIWKGSVPLCEMFEKKFAVKSVLSNDANAAAFGESIFGVGKKYSNFVQITLGTGVGSGIVIDGKLILGAHGYAGEFGHIRVIKDGRTCKCGRKGCLETYTSATGVMRTFEELKATYPSSILHNYEIVTPKEIFQAFYQNDELAVTIIDQTAQILGNALADFACFSDPQVYVLFGGMVINNQFFVELVQKYMDANLLSIFNGKIAVVRSELPSGNAALLGASAVYLSTLDDE